MPFTGRAARAQCLYLDVASEESGTGAAAAPGGRPELPGRCAAAASRPRLVALAVAACLGLVASRETVAVAIRHKSDGSVATAEGYMQLEGEPLRNPFLEVSQDAEAPKVGPTPARADPFVEAPRRAEDSRALLVTTKAPAARWAPAPAPALAPTSPEPTTTTTTAAATSTASVVDLKPVEDMHDGNPCDFNEEYHGGLCYKKCSLLTEGREPIRVNPWTCCKEEPCSYRDEEARSGGLTRLFCAGYDVGGDGGCPHQPGACLKNEELYHGLCYEKCDALTRGQFPHRVGFATCCKTRGLGCMDIFRDKSSAAFDVGGGAGDGDPGTPAFPHPPLAGLTEDASYRLPSAALAARNVSARAARAALGQRLRKARPQRAPELASGGCGSAEELYGGLCYKKCSLLTKGEARIRTSSWTCCREQPCGPKATVGKVTLRLLCDGYDVGEGGGCPHAPGVCREDEESLGALCYRKCSLLTGGAYPHRTAASTCCKTTGLRCLLGSDAKTDAAFAVGSDEGVGEKARQRPRHATYAQSAY